MPVPLDGAALKDMSQDCDRHLAVQARVVGRVDDPHPAVAEFGAEGVRAEGGAWGEGRGTRPIIPPRGGLRPAIPPQRGIRSILYRRVSLRPDLMS